MKRIFKTPYVYWTIGIFVAYTALNVILSQFYVTVKYIPYYLETLNWTELGISAVLTFAIASLISVNSVYGYIRYLESKDVKTCALGTSAGTLVGLSTGVCAACVAGAFPALLNVIGITFSWASLPLKGVEVQLATVAILGASLYLLNKR